MVATLFITEYRTIGSRDPNSADDIAGTIPQLPGANPEARYAELATATAQTHVFHSKTTYIKIQSFAGDVLLNYDAADTGGDSLVSDNREPLSEGATIFQGIVDMDTGDQVYTQINAIDKP